MGDFTSGFNTHARTHARRLKGGGSYRPLAGTPAHFEQMRKDKRLETCFGRTLGVACDHSKQKTTSHKCFDESEDMQSALELVLVLTVLKTDK